MQDSASSVSSGASPARIQPHRKLMRKGTRSCTECRRRKVRCIFVRGSAVCEHCSTRGIACIDQRDRVDHDVCNARSHPGSSHGASRDPSQKPSPLLTGPVPEDEDESFDVESPGDQSCTHPPLVSMLKKTQHSEHSASISRVLSNTPRKDAAVAPDPRVPKDKSSPVCEALRSALPPYDAIATTLSNNSSWWDSFRQKTRVITQSEPPFTPLNRFAAQAYTSSDPAEMGMLAVAYTRSLGQSHRILGLVDSLVISDFSLVSTQDGMGCVVLLAKTFTDIGQPRRAWLTWRRGLAVAQLMGLHRLPQDHSALHHRIWLAIYHGDRFTSLLLGLPHAVNDALSPSSPVPAHISPGPLHIWLPAFIHGCAVMAGQAIECNIPTPRPSFARAMLLDEQMEAMAGSAPPWWWDVPAECPSSPAEINGLVDRLLIHIFFHVRMYIHLPFLSSSAQPSSKYSTSRVACVDAARNLVARFLLLWSDIPGTTRSLFDCKTSDFVGFAATAVLLAGRSHSSGVKAAEGDDGSDLRLVAQVRETLQRLEERGGCKVAAPCRAALAQLAGPSSLPSSLPSTSPQNTETTVLIPYLGNLVLRRQFEDDENPQTNDGSSHHHHPPQMQQPDPSWYATPHDEPDSSDGSPLSMEMDYSVEYMGYQPSQPVFMGGGCGSGWGSGGEGGDGFGLDAASLDIDQDWNLFAPFFCV